VQLLKSLFCLQGFDNRSRFLAICSAIYIIFMMLSSAFTGKLIISVVIGGLFSVVLALTTLRRLQDARLNKNWLFAPSLSFALIALIIIFSQQHSSYYLLLIPALSSAVLLTYTSKQHSSVQSYTLGYIGPVDLSEYQQVAHQGKSAQFRIEPSIAGDSAINIDPLQQNKQQDEQQDEQQAHAACAFQHNQQTSTHDSAQTDIGELIRLKLLGNKKAQLTILVIVIVTLVAVLSSWLLTFFSASGANSIAQPVTQISSATSTNTDIVRTHPLAMPDNFNLYLSQHKGVIINWQADEVNTSQLWSQVSAQGDASCQKISFNKGETLRTLTVDVESKDGVNTDYFASFSPLDSQALIQSLAFRGKFSLCGYDFSLKGSQAALGKNKHYAQWVNY